MKAQITQEKWKVDERQDHLAVIDKSKWVVAILKINYYKGATPEIKSKARLISAAPKMGEVLEKLTRLNADERRHMKGPLGWKDYNAWQSEYREAWQEAREVLLAAGYTEE